MRNIWILALAQAFAASGTIMLVTFGGIVGTRVAPEPELATLPLSLAILGTALASLPVALLMRHFGRKAVLIGSALLGSLTALLFAWGVARESFAALCVSGMIVGVTTAVVQQYRFAAVEYVDYPQAGRAIATVMLGTLVAAVAAPAIGSTARHLGGWPEFTGSYVALAGLSLLAALVLLALEEPLGRPHVATHAARPLRDVALQPAYLVALLAGVSSYAVMSFIMTATPISMHVHDHLNVDDTRAVISGHLLGMYLPSLVSGWLVRVLGLRRMMLAGIACMAACAGFAAGLGHDFPSYLLALTLLGIGWNFLFVAGTTLLTTTYAPSERFKAQGLNDFAVFGSQALASLLAAGAIENLGWERMNLAALPLLALMLAALMWQRRAAPAPLSDKKLAQRSQQ